MYCICTLSFPIFLQPARIACERKFVVFLITSSAAAAVHYCLLCLVKFERWDEWNFAGKVQLTPSRQYLLQSSSHKAKRLHHCPLCWQSQVLNRGLQNDSLLVPCCICMQTADVETTYRTFHVFWNAASLPTKPYAATSLHHSVDHLITHGSVDQATHATTGWSTSVRTPAFLLQLIYGAGPSSADTERPGWLRDDDDAFPLDPLITSKWFLLICLIWKK